MADALFSLSKAKAQLILEHPFYASLLCNLPFVEDASVKTMAVDGKNVYYNPDFVNSLTIPELKFVECHEVMHCVLNHMSRRGNLDPKKYNIAGDFVINDMLVTDGIGKMPEIGLYDADLVKRGGYMTKGVYDLLPDGDGDGTGEGDGGYEPLDEVRDGLSQEEVHEVEEIWKIRAVHAGQAAKMHGKLGAGAKRLVDSITKPVVPWKELLRRFVSKRVKTERSFARPNRRFISQGMYLPSLGGVALGEIAIAVDCSGSIGQKEIDAFAAEIKEIHQTLRPTRVNVLYFDSEISHTEAYEVDDDLDIKPHGGGGTAFSPIFTALNAMENKPECCVVLTDLCCNDFGDAPDYPVLWVTNDSEEAPWGEVVKMQASN